MTAELDRLLINLGVNPRMKGYSYLFDGVMLAYYKPELLGALTKELYPEIAKLRRGVTASQVERNLRYAIFVAWNEDKTRAFERILDYGLPLDQPPKTGAVIALLVNKLRG